METRFTPTARRVARLGAHARRLRHEVVAWALATGRSVDFDALTVIIAAKSEMPRPLRRWTEDDVWRLWWLDLSGWCTRHGIDPPPGLAGALITVVRHLDEGGRLEAGSDSAMVLVDALESAGGFGTLRTPASVS